MKASHWLVGHVTVQPNSADSKTQRHITHVFQISLFLIRNIFIDILTIVIGLLFSEVFSQFVLQLVILLLNLFSFSQCLLKVSMLGIYIYVVN